MLNRFFEFATTSANSVIKNITIVSNVITFFNGKPQKKGEPGEFRLLDDLKQKHTPCHDQPFGKLITDEHAHRVIKPHQTSIDESIGHSHKITCGPVTPPTVEALMHSLQELKDDKTRMSAFMNHNRQLIENARLQYGLESINTNMRNMEFISEKDADELIRQFKKHYHENGGKMKRAFEHEQEVIQQGTTSEIAYQAGRSAFAAAGIEMIRQGLVRSKWSERNIDLTIHILLLMFVISQTKDIMPALLSPILARVTAATLPSGYANVVNTAIALGSAVMYPEMMNTRYGIIKFTASFVSSALSTMFTRNTLNYFFGSPQAEPQPDIAIRIRVMRAAL